MGAGANSTLERDVMKSLTFYRRHGEMKSEEKSIRVGVGENPHASFRSIRGTPFITFAKRWLFQKQS